LLNLLDCITRALTSIITNIEHFVETQRKYDKNGNVISRVEKLQQANLVDVPDGLELSRVSTNVTTGQQWLIHTKESQNKALFKLNKDLINANTKGS
jgi:hypothetical protein